MRLMGHWDHFQPSYIQKYTRNPAPTMSLFSEPPPAVLQEVIRGLARKNNRIHVVLLTCRHPRTPRGARSPALDIEKRR